VRTWNGAGNGADWSTSNGSQQRGNWGGTQFLTNDDAVFGGATGLGPTIGTTSLAAGSITFNNTSGAFTIGGTATLTINGGILNNDNSLQNFGVSTITLGGSQTWNAGTSAGGGLAFSGTTLNLGNNQTLTIDGSNNTSITNAINGTGTSGILKTGSGTLTLSGATNYSGLTTINGGTLALGANDRFANGATVVVAGGILDTTASNWTDTVGVLNMSSGSLNGGGTITAATYGLGGGTVNANLGAGTINVTSGTTNLIGASAATVLNLNSGTLSLGASNRLADAAAVTANGGTFAIGNFSDTVGAVSLASGSISGAGGTLTGSSYAVQSGSISAILGGSGVSLTKTTTNTATLSRANSYTGDTIIKAGTLKLDGSGNVASTNIIVGDTGSTGAILDATAKTGGFIVASGKTVGGIGTIQGSTTIQGILAPGNSTGILNNLGDIELEITSTFQMEIGGTVAGTGYDQLNVTGSVTLAGLLAVNTGLYNPNSGDLFFLIKNDGVDAINGRFSNADADDTTVVTLDGRAWLISYTANFENVIPTFTGGNDVALMAVPEPHAALIGGIGVLFLLRRRRA
jgi:autotransporter-associated beta strand protein